MVWVILIIVLIVIGLMFSGVSKKNEELHEKVETNTNIEHRVLCLS